jgi:hypothetical protein
MEGKVNNGKSLLLGQAEAQLSEALSYKPEGHGSVTDSVIRIPR